MPAVLGHEAAGDVLEVGEGVDDLEPGDRVIVNWLPACGSCAACLRGKPYLCMAHVMAGYAMPRFMAGDPPAFGMAGCGAFAEEMVVPRSGVVQIGADVPYEVAAILGCGVMTGVGAVVNTAAVRPGDTVVVIGCGGVGIAAIQGARVAGAAVIVAVDTVPAKHEVARRFGATHAVAPAGSAICPARSPAARASTTRSTSWPCRRRCVRRGPPSVGVGRWSWSAPAAPTTTSSSARSSCSSKASGSSRRCTVRPTRRATSAACWPCGGPVGSTSDGMVSHRLRLDQLDDALASLGRGDVIRQVIVHD